MYQLESRNLSEFTGENATHKIMFTKGDHVIIDNKFLCDIRPYVENNFADIKNDELRIELVKFFAPESLLYHKDEKIRDEIIQSPCNMLRSLGADEFMRIQNKYKIEFSKTKLWELIDIDNTIDGKFKYNLYNLKNFTEITSAAEQIANLPMELYRDLFNFFHKYTYMDIMKGICKNAIIDDIERYKIYFNDSELFELIAEFNDELKEGANFKLTKNRNTVREYIINKLK